MVRTFWGTLGRATQHDFVKVMPAPIVTGWRDSGPSWGFRTVPWSLGYRQADAAPRAGGSGGQRRTVEPVEQSVEMLGGDSSPVFYRTRRFVISSSSAEGGDIHRVHSVVWPQRILSRDSPNTWRVIRDRPQRYRFALRHGRDSRATCLARVYIRGGRAATAGDLSRVSADTPPRIDRCRRLCGLANASTVNNWTL